MGPPILKSAPLVSQKITHHAAPAAAEGVLLCLTHFLMDVLQSPHVSVMPTAKVPRTFGVPSPLDSGMGLDCVGQGSRGDF